MNFFNQFKRYLIYKLKHKVNIDSLFKNFDKLDIDQIFTHFGSDKANIFQPGIASREYEQKKTTGHGYSKFYEKHLSAFKNKELNILEIGSYSGASAASFVKYFQFSKVYCLDINLSNFNITSKKIRAFGLDISNKSMVGQFFEKINISEENKFFDIIVDDGSHKLSDILRAINFLYKNLKPNGFYIIEDYKFPNYYDHLNDCSEIKIDELLDCIKNKKIFKSNIISEKMIESLIDNTGQVYIYKGLLDYSDIAFLKKLN